MKKKSNNKMRQSTKYVFIILAVIFLFVALKSILAMSKNTKITKEIYSSTNSFSYTYNINLLDNKYMSEEDLKNTSKFYVTGLIDTIDLNLNYTYEGSRDVPVNTLYRIVGRLEGVYTGEQAEQKIWQKEYILKDYQTLNNTSKSFKINEKLELDLKDINALVKRFQDDLGISLDAKYVVSMEILNKSLIENNEEEISYSPNISIDLGKKVTGISGENNSDTSYVTREYPRKSELNIFVLTADLLLMLISVFLISKVLRSETKVNIRNEYRQELNRLLRLCSDKIVQVSTVPSIDNGGFVEVKDFEEIIKLSEELFKPILYWEDKQKENAWFIVMSNSVQYCYILKNKSLERNINEKKI